MLWNRGRLLLKGDGTRQPVIPANQETYRKIIDSLELQTDFKATWATWQDPASK